MVINDGKLKFTLMRGNYGLLGHIKRVDSSKPEFITLYKRAFYVQGDEMPINDYTLDFIDAIRFILSNEVLMEDYTCLFKQSLINDSIPIGKASTIVDFIHRFKKVLRTSDPLVFKAFRMYWDTGRFSE